MRVENSWTLLAEKQPTKARDPWTLSVNSDLPKTTMNLLRIPTEGYDYFVFEFVYFQLPIITCQLFGRLILPKKIYFNFIAVIGALSVLSICSLRMFLFILLISYVSKTFQKEHPFFQWTATLIGLTFSGYVRYRGQYYGTTILEIQILLASLFRMIGCCPIEGPEFTSPRYACKLNYKTLELFGCFISEFACISSQVINLFNLCFIIGYSP